MLLVKRKNEKNMLADLNVKLSVIQSAGYSQTVICFIRLHSVSGARISDLLRIRRSDITSSLYVSIRQCKGSMPLTVKLSDDLQFWREYRAGLHLDIGLFNKNYFYRLYKRYNIQFNNGMGRNMSVTHSFRKELANDLFEATGLIESSQAALGHRSSRSTEYYLTKDNLRAIQKQGINSPLSGSVNNIIVSKRNGATYIRLKK